MTCNGIDFDAIRAVACKAGAAIMAIYEGGFSVETKADDTPVTCADRAAHQVIVEGLRAATPGIPVLSEEGQDIPFATRKGWLRFWLVDPLDGTREFINRNGEFTVNIALVEAGVATAGVVHVPAQQKTYLGIREQGAWLQWEGQEPLPIRVRHPDPGSGLRVVMSRSHPSPDLVEYLRTIRVAEAVAVGSSLKFCVVAEGRADLYPRLGPTMEWDTAAGQAVVEAAGGTVLTLDGLPLRYNKAELLNPYFVVSGLRGQS